MLWEITGNGLTKPSYLFGTMHISNKMVFHLSDSFYAAIRSADVVAIELNPEQWQSELPRLNKQGELYKYYNASYYTDYLKEDSYTEGDFLPQLQEALRFEPPINDALLYRSESRMDNFQEDTYLDLYIYQTGKKLGKQTAGVETFMGSQRMMIEAFVDAAADKDKKKETEGVNAYELSQSLQDAYRKGDLDVLDSINKLTEYAESFTEKFLYKRNEIQAASMDSIMRSHSLFVGVGAAHLPGKRGVIEILRKKGYTLRPVLMQDRDAQQKRIIDSLTVPVQFMEQYATDSMFRVKVPGKLNDLSSRRFTLQHYADMGNGSFYLINRIKTNAVFNGLGAQRILKMLDSLLYENIPGAILSSKAITRDGYPGIDIRNKTRKGDQQRYQLIVTPSELFVFKMGGKGDYVEGKEAAEFFGSIRFKEPAAGGWQTYTSPSGGFSVSMPAKPRVFFSAVASDGLPEWKYEAVDPVSEDKFAVIRKSIYSFDFIEPDTFDLMLITESFGSSDKWEEIKKSTPARVQGRPVRDISFRAKDGDYIQARAILLGPQYYLLVHRSHSKDSKPAAFFNSFSFAPFQYPAPQPFTDTAMRFSVRTSVKPVFDEDIVDMMSYVKRQEPALKKDAPYVNEPEVSYANFISEETGEVIVVNRYQFPPYFFVKDSLAFWNNQFTPDSGLVLRQKTRLDRGLGVQAWMLEWADTGSTRLIRKLILQKDMDMLTVTTMRDSTLPLSIFLNEFYSTFAFKGTHTPGNLYRNKQDIFFSDYYSSDTTRRNRARTGLPSVYFGKEGYPQLLTAMARLKPGDKNYYETKTRLIAEMGSVTDSVIKDTITRQLKQLYLASGDTTLFQNSVLKALAMQGTPQATALFKELILQDPPAFDESYEYAGLFSTYNDSLKLAAKLYPEVMNLTAAEDFKAPVRELLAALIDSSYIQPALYDDFAGNIYFDAKIALKKLQYASESTQGRKEEDEDTYSRERTYRAPGQADAYGSTDMLTYVKLLAPFYRQNPNLPKFFDKLLSLGNRQIKLNTALTLLKYKEPVADSIWISLAEEKDYRNYLYNRLRENGHQSYFPKRYQNAQAIAASLLYASYGSRLDSLVVLEHAPMMQPEKTVTSYFYKYKMKRSGDWKLAISSVKQEKGKAIEGYTKLMVLSDKKLAATPAAISRQIAEQFRKLYISRSYSGSRFYNEDRYSNTYAATDYMDN